MTATSLLQVLAGFLAAYHVGIGVFAVCSPRTAAHVAGVLYELQAPDLPQLRYGVRMLGLYALAIGALLIVATLAPHEHVAIIVVVAALQTARAVARIVLRADVQEAFGIPRRRNAVNAGLLLVEAGALGVLVLMMR